jgi:hypothetical protein
MGNLARRPDPAGIAACDGGGGGARTTIGFADITPLLRPLNLA